MCVVVIIIYTAHSAGKEGCVLRMVAHEKVKWCGEMVQENSKQNSCELMECLSLII